MARMLDVYLHRNLVGQLIQDEQGRILFGYAENWLDKPGAIPLSYSLPLQKEHFSGKACRGFFGGVLPEGNIRELVARNLGISARNDYAMLEQIGGECAGAVIFVPAGESLPELDYSYRHLEEAELARMLRELPRRPLMAGEEGVRLSLAGAQDKIAVHVSDERISLMLATAPSTHILKPAISHFEGVVFNEVCCMKLASAVGLSVANVEVRQVEDIDYLLVERYDRKRSKSGEVERLHQEDFCQALAVPPEMKYQSEGGPSLKQCFSLLREVSTMPVVDLQRLLDTVVFNALIGNHNAHAKNFSLIYEAGSTMRLAPLYDLVSTVYYPELSSKMAMRVGGEYESDKLFTRHFEKLAEEAGLAKPLVRRRVRELAHATVEALPTLEINHQVARDVMRLIQKRCELFIERFKG
jgi:serine/threonine-protein kinase HipA